MSLAPVYFPPNDSRVVCEIEQTLRRGVDGLHIDKGKVEDHKLKIQELLGTLNAPLNKGFAGDVCAPPATTSASKDGAYSAGPRRPHAKYILIARVFNFNPPACRRLIRRGFAPHELSSLIEAIFSNEDEGGVIRRLLSDNAQTFIDVMDEVRLTYARSPLGTH